MIILTSILDQIRTLKDGGLKIVLETPELEVDQISKIFRLRNKQIFVGFKDAPLKPDDFNIKEVETEFKTGKTPSQRLRAVLYVYWEQNKPTKEFDEFYKKKMEDFINLVKDKLN